MGTNYIAPIWRMPRNANKDKISNYSIFNGNTYDHILTTSPYTFIQETGVFTFSAFFKLSNYLGFTNTGPLSALNVIASTAFGGSEYGFAIYYDNRQAAGQKQNLQFNLYTGGSTTSISVNKDDPLYINDNDWHHVVVTGDGTNLRMYLDNSLLQVNRTTDTQVAIAGLSSTTSTRNLGFIGISSAVNSYPFKGQLSQFLLYDYELTTSQRTSIYNNENPFAIGTAPQGYYELGSNSNPNANAGYPNISVGADSVFDFDSSKVLNSATLSDLGISNEFSFSIWAKLDTITGYRGPLGATNWYDGFGVWIDTKWHFFVNHWDNHKITSDTLATIGVWVHLVGTFSSSGTGKFYINGTKEGTDITGVTLNGLSRELIIGAIEGTNYFQGMLTNTQIWNKELTASEALTLYNNGQPLMTGTQPQENNLQAWYKLNQSANWDLFGQSKWTISDSTSPYTKSFSLDSANSPADYFNTNSGPRGMTTNVGTYSCWINLNSVAGTQVFMDVAGFASREFLVLQIRNNNALQMQMRSWSIQMQWDSVTTTPFEIGKWYHVVAVGDGTNIKMYINGEEISTYIASGSYKWWSNFNTNIAHNGGNRINLGAGVYPTRHSPLNGKISNAQIWNTNLSSSQIETLYNNGKPLQGTQPAQTNLLAWYKLNQDSTWTNYNYWNNIFVNKWSSKNSAITTTPPAESFGFSGNAQDGDYEGWEVTNKSISGSLLLSFWYKTTGDAVFTWTFNNDGSGNTNAGHARMQGNGYIYFFSPNASNYFYRNNTNIGDYNWHNLIIYIPNGSPTYDANDINMWQDGVELGKPTIVGSTTWDAFTEIKGMNRNSSSSNNGTGTQWSNWALFENVTPSDSVIDTIFNGGTPGDISSLNPSIWYKLDNTDTTFATTGSKATALSITDSSSNNNDATGPYDYDAAVNSRPVLINGNVENAIAGYYMDGSELVDLSVSTLNGKSSGMNTTNLVQSNLTRKVPYSNYSVNFDGVGDYMDSTNISYFSGADRCSLSVWFKVDSSDDGLNNRDVISKGSSSAGTTSFLLRKQKNGNGNKVQFSFDEGVTNFYSTTQIQNNVWYHVAIVYKGYESNNSDRLKIYVDGQNVTASYTATVPTTLVSSTQPFRIARWQTSSTDFNGLISNVCAWESVITDDDVINLYNNGITQDLNNFRVTPNYWWPLDQNSTYFNGSVLIGREVIGALDGTGVNIIQSNIIGNAPGSEANGTGTNLTIADLKGDMKSSINNSYSINMADYADGVTNPANSGRSTDTP